MDQAMFLAHWGDEKHTCNTGAWRSLHGLGISAKKPMRSADINKLVNDTYNQFCSASARRSEDALNSPTHSNMLMRICDFATIIEAKRAMKDGDPRSLMYMWKLWAVMGQGIPKLPHYSKHLPCLILLLEKVLPPSQAKIVKSTTDIANRESWPLCAN
jgi:hypothetical protein